MWPNGNLRVASLWRSARHGPSDTELLIGAQGALGLGLRGRRRGEVPRVFRPRDACRQCLEDVRRQEADRHCPPQGIPGRECSKAGGAQAEAVRPGVPRRSAGVAACSSWAAKGVCHEWACTAWQDSLLSCHPRRSKHPLRIEKDIDRDRDRDRATERQRQRQKQRQRQRQRQRQTHKHKQR